jgi:chromosome segregation ATPase
MKREKRLDARGFVIIALLCGALLALSLAAAGCNDQMAQMQENQTRLQAMVAANARQLATISSQVHAGQGELDEHIATLENNQQRTQAEVVAVRSEQDLLRQAVADSNRQLAAKLAKLEENQTLLRDGVAQVANMVQTTNTSVSAIAREQATLHRMVQQNKTELAEAVTAVARNQETTHAGLGELRQADRDLAGAVAAVTERQKATLKLIEDNSQQLSGRLTTLAANQGQLGEHLGNLQGLTEGLAADLTTVAKEQTSMHGTLRNQAVALTDKIAVVEHNQQSIQSIIDKVANTATATADGVNALASAQAAIERQQGTNHTALTTQLAALSRNQEDLQTGIGTIDAKTDLAAAGLAALASGQDVIQQTMAHNNETLTASSERQVQLKRGMDSLDSKADALASGVAAVSTELTGLQETVITANRSLVAQQTALQQTMHNHSEDTHRQTSGLVASQETLQGHLDRLMGTTVQVALDVFALDNRQSSLSDTLARHGETISSQVTELSQTQQRMQSGLDVVTATAGQIAHDVTTLGGNQARLAQAVAADRDTLAEKLTEIVQGQNHWLTRFDDTQTQMQSMTASLIAVEQQVAHLQGTFRSDLQGITTELTDGTQHRAQLEQTVNQNVQALAEQIAQLREMQSSVQQQMQQLQNGTQSQNREILLALEQLQRQADTRPIGSGAERTSSSTVATQEVQLP